MARKPPSLYHVFKANDNSQIVTGVPLAVARSEAARLNAEAGIVEGEAHAQIGTDETGAPITRRVGPRYRGMVNGEVSRYEVRSAEGVVLG